MALDYPTLTPNTNALPQGGDITVTAPYSGLIPAGYYDGLETLTANGWGLSPQSWLTLDIAESGWVRNQVTGAFQTKEYAKILYERSTEIFGFSILTFAWWAVDLVCFSFNKTSNQQSLEWSTTLSNYFSTNSWYYNNDTIVLNRTNSSAQQRYTEYAILTNTFSWWSWHLTVWTLIFSWGWTFPWIPYLWYTAKMYTSRWTWATAQWINCFELS